LRLREFSQFLLQPPPKNQAAFERLLFFGGNEAVRLRFMARRAASCFAVEPQSASSTALPAPPDDEALSLRANMKRSAFASHEALSLREQRFPEISSAFCRDDMGR